VCTAAGVLTHADDALAACATAAPSSVDEACAQALAQLAALDPPTAAAVANGLGPFLSVATLLFIIRRAPEDSTRQRAGGCAAVTPPAHAPLRLTRASAVVDVRTRIVMTWYPNIKDDAFPWIIVYAPTEPLLAPTRKLITPVGCAPAGAA
jgi:hypothetical protein